MAEGDRNKQWALRSIRSEAMGGPKGPASFASAIAGGFDEGERAVYVSSCLRYPYGPFMLATTARLGATNFPAAGDASRLRKLGDNYQLRQYPTEPDARFEQRLGLAWDLHEEGGTSIAVRKALEAYGFPEINILEECYYPVLADGADYGWAFVVVLGPNYGDVLVEGLILDDFDLDGDDAYLGTGTFSKDQIDDLVRIILESRQVHDMPWHIVFRFDDIPLLDLISLDDFYLDGSTLGSEAEIAHIQSAFALDEWTLGDATLDDFGVDNGN